MNWDHHRDTTCPERSVPALRQDSLDLRYVEAEEEADGNDLAELLAVDAEQLVRHLVVLVVDKNQPALNFSVSMRTFKNTPVEKAEGEVDKEEEKKVSPDLLQWHSIVRNDRPCRFSKTFQQNCKN